MRCGQAAFIYTTLPSGREAREMGEKLVREKLAACVNILPGMQSIYEWKGRLEHGDEVVLIAKTVPERAEEVMRRVAELHPYEVPAIAHLPALSVHAPYLDWLRENSSAA